MRGKQMEITDQKSARKISLGFRKISLVFRKFRLDFKKNSLIFLKMFLRLFSLQIFSIREDCVPLQQEYEAMTQKEEELLRSLALAVDRLKAYNSKQGERLAALEEEKATLQKKCDDLREMNADLRSKNDLLLASRVIVADESDWLRARQRLEDLRKDILQGIKLLETE